VSSISLRDRDAHVAGDLLLLRGRPVWVLAGQAAIAISVIISFGALGDFRPKLLSLMLIACAAGTVFLGPSGGLGRILVSAPVVMVVAWWLMSYSWTFNIYGWTRQTEAEIPLIATLVVVMSLIPIQSIEQALVNSCHAAIAWTVLYIGMHPSTATVNPDGVPGWRGDFIHKNGMAPFMLFAILMIAAFERRTALRGGMIVVAAVLVLMSQSTTTATTALVILPLAFLLRKITRSDVRQSSAIVAGSASAIVVFAFLIMTYLPSLLTFSGKDPTLSARTLIWARVLTAASKRPFTGYGVGGVWINQGSEPTLTIMRGLGFTVFHSHNGFLEILIELGALGLVCFLVLLSSVVIGGYRLLHSSPRWGAVLILFAALITIISLAEVATFGPWLGMLCGLRVVQLRETRPTQ